MAHTHNLRDTDPHFVIDPATRVITNKSGKVVLSQYDHNSERFTFELPLKIDDHDMSKCDRVEIHFLNVGSTGRNPGIYLVTDLQVDEKDHDVVVCSWLVANNATQLAGTLNFIIRFICTEEGKEVYVWNTIPHTGISVTAGINNYEPFEEDYSNIITEWYNQFIAAENSALNNIVEAEKTAERAFSEYFAERVDDIRNETSDSISTIDTHVTSVTKDITDHGDSAKQEITTHGEQVKTDISTSGALEPINADIAALESGKRDVISSNVSIYLGEHLLYSKGGVWKNEGNLRATQSIVASTVPLRTTSGNVTSGLPVNPDDCIPLEYADAMMEEVNTLLEDKVDKVKNNSVFILYGQAKNSTSISPQKLDLYPAPNAVPVRSASSNVKTGLPVDDNDSVPRQYADAILQELRDFKASLPSFYTSTLDDITMLKGGTKGLFYSVVQSDYATCVHDDNVTDKDIYVAYFYESKPVTDIGDEAFKNNTTATKFVLPDTITRIGMYAFAGTTIESLTLPKSVESIVDHAFENAESINGYTFEIPSGVSYIGERAFYNATIFGENSIIRIPGGAEVKYHAFEGSNISKVLLNYGVVCEARAFENCSSLKEVTVYIDNVDDISTDMLGTCSNVEKITIYDDGYGYIKDDPSLILDDQNRPFGVVNQPSLEYYTSQDDLWRDWDYTNTTWIERSTE